METWAKIAYRYNRAYRKITVLCEQQNHRCCYCGIPLLVNHPTNPPNLATIEHVVPISLGGARVFGNEVAACRLCNNLRRSDIDALEFYDWRIKQDTHDFNTIKKSVNRYRKNRHKHQVAAKLEKIHHYRMRRAEKVPYWLRIVDVANRFMIGWVNRIADQIMPRKYRQSQEVAEARETDRNRPRNTRRIGRHRHRGANAVGDTNTDHVGQ